MRKTSIVFLALLAIATQVFGQKMFKNRESITIFQPGELYSNPNIAEDEGVLSQLREQFTAAELQYILDNCSEEKWPTTISTLDGRGENLLNYVFYKIGNYDDNGTAMLVVLAPAAENKDLEEGMRPERDIVFIFNETALVESESVPKMLEEEEEYDMLPMPQELTFEAARTVTTAPENSFQRQMQTAVKAFRDNFVSIKAGNVPLKNTTDCFPTTLTVKNALRTQIRHEGENNKNVFEIVLAENITAEEAQKIMTQLSLDIKGCVYDELDLQVLEEVDEVGHTFVLSPAVIYGENNEKYKNLRLSYGSLSDVNDETKFRVVVNLIDIE